MKKKIIVTLIVVALASIIATIIYFIITEKQQEISTNPVNNQNTVVEEFVQVLEDGSKLNTSTKLNETKNVKGFEIGNIKLSMVGGETTLLANVKNNTGKDQGITGIDIILLNKEGKEIVTMGGVIEKVKSGESVKLQAGTTLDFANAYDFKIEIK